MTLHKPKRSEPRKFRPRRQLPRELTIGDVLGAQLRQAQAERARRAELDDAGFKPIAGAP